MDELADRLQFGIAGNFLLEPVFHRLHVMVGNALDVLDPLGIGDGERLDQVVENLERGFAQRRHFGNVRMAGQRLQPVDFNLHPMADQAVLAEDRPQVGGFVGIAAVNGGNSGESGEFHGSTS